MKYSEVTVIPLRAKRGTEEPADAAATEVWDTSQCFPMCPQLDIVLKAVYYKHAHFQVWGKKQIEQNVLY